MKTEAGVSYHVAKDHLPKLLSDELRAIAQGIKDHRRTGYTLSVIKLEELAKMAEQLERNKE